MATAVEVSLKLRTGDAIVEFLRSKTFSIDAEITRSLAPQFDLTEVDALRIVVIPKTDVRTRFTRALIQREIKCDVGVMQRVGGNEDEAIDLVLRVVDEVVDALERPDGRPIPGLEDSTPVSPIVRPDPDYDPDQLREHKVVMSAFSIMTRFYKKG